MTEVAAVVVAAGRGLRAGGDVPKQFRRIGGETVLRRTLSMLVEAPNLVALVQPVIRAEDRGLFDAAASAMQILPPVTGGATRQASVRAGLEALAPHRPDIVLIHDAA
ncbi:MAG TPA: 2-C-methyl-D-erythritol 4-phosphate cytidylyltransferase, partial [Pseudolabrys sp.]